MMWQPREMPLVEAAILDVLRNADAYIKRSAAILDAADAAAAVALKLGKPQGAVVKQTVAALRPIVQSHLPAAASASSLAVAAMAA